MGHKKKRWIFGFLENYPYICREVAKFIDMKPGGRLAGKQVPGLRLPKVVIVVVYIGGLEDGTFLLPTFQGN